jgi:PAS domain S-box-containing protein
LRDGSTSDAETPAGDSRRVAIAFGRAAALATTAAALGSALWVSLFASPEGQLLPVLAIAAWGASCLVDRRSVQVAGSIACLFAFTWQAVAGPDDALAAALASTALFAAASGPGVARTRATAALALAAFGALLYIGAYSLVVRAPRVDGAATALPNLLALCVASTAAAWIDWRTAPAPATRVALLGMGVVLAAIAGLVSGAHFLADVVPGHTPMSLEGALSMLLLLGTIPAVQRRNVPLAMAALIPVGMLALYVVAMREQVPPRGAVPAEFSWGWWLGQRAQALAAVTLLVGSISLAVATLFRGRGARAIVWSSGVLLVVMSALSLVATIIASTSPEIDLGGPPAAVPPVLATLAMGIALLQIDPDGPRLRSLWLPLLGGLLVLAAAIDLARVSQVERLAREARDGEAAADAAQAAIVAALDARVASMDRFARRLLAVSAGERSRLFEVEAEQALRSSLAMQSVAWVDHERRVRQIRSRLGTRRLVGASAAFDPERRAAYDRAATTGSAQAIGPLVLANTDIDAVVVVHPGAFGDGAPEFLVGAFRYDDLLAGALAGIGPGLVLQAGSGGRQHVLHGPPRQGSSWSAAPRREFDALGMRWVVRALPAEGREDGVFLARAVLSGGVLLSVLLALALRFGALARERALIAEATAGALRDEAAARERTQVALDRTRQQAERLLEGMSDGVITLDRELRVVYVNPQGRGLLQAVAAEPVGARLADLFPLFAGSEFERVFRHVVDQRQEAAIDAYAVALGRWLAGRVYPLDDGLTAILSDVTELRLTERFEREQGVVLRAIASAEPLPTCLAKCVRLYESRFDGAIGTVLRYDPLRDCVFGGVAPSLPDEYNRIWDGARPGPAACSCGTAVFRRERVVVEDIARDPLWAEMRAAPAAFGLRACWSQPIFAADGAVLGTFAVYYRTVRGPTPEESEGLDSVAALVGIALQRERAERSIESSRQRFLSLFERSPNMVYAFDLERRLVDCNHNAELGGGFPRSLLIGMPAEQLVMPQHRGAVALAFDAALRGEPVSFDCAVLTADRRRREVAASLVPIVVDGSIVGVFGIVQDMTDARRVSAELDRAVQDLQLRNLELQDFAFVASHDLQEPLRKVQAFSDRVIQRYADQLDPQAVDYLRRIDGAAHRMQVLIDDLLAYSRITSQGQPFAPVDLGEVAREVLSDLEVRIDESGARIEVGELPVVDGDRTQLRQLLQNLLANALKFRSPGRPPHVVVDATPAEPGQMVLRVADNGIGFEPQHAERIFAPFQRLHGRQQYEGTGIGLAVVRKIVERHAGRIRAIGRPGEGATFEVTLPRSRSGH